MKPEFTVKFKDIITWLLILGLAFVGVKMATEIQVVNAYKQINQNAANINAIAEILKKEGLIKTQQPAVPTKERSNDCTL